MLRISLSIPPAAFSTEAAILRTLAAQKLRVPPDTVTEVILRKKSVDARAGRSLSLRLTLDVTVSQEQAILLQKIPEVQSAPLLAPAIHFPKTRPRLAHPPLVVGMGPAGLFAAKTLCDAGLPPRLIERGQPVAQRAQDVSAFFAGGPLVPNSNVQFGEGGAGTFSDGKLATGIKSPYIPEVLRTFVTFGAPEEILWQARPHIGTDRLRALLPGFREYLLQAGAELHFGTRLKELVVERGALCAVVVQNAAGVEDAVPCEVLFLAIGHSARDTLAMLHRSGLAMEQKPFSLGLRIEHLQKEIDKAQYGAFAGHPALGAADYKLAVHLPEGRGVYTFCMCPGGAVVASASEPGGLCVNGMSSFARDLPNANSAVLVSVLPEDFPDAHPLSGIALQRKWEQAAYHLAGNSYRAPVQLLDDFLQGRPSTGPGAVRPSYRPGCTWGNVSDALPSFVTTSLRAAFPLLERKLRGFAHPEAVLTGPETRSSSPVRLLRGEDGQSTGMTGVYPIGEGAGYAGGITSSAVDGIQAVLQMLQNRDC